jgi:thiol-disulfide isomerase/thioredoxin
LLKRYKRNVNVKKVILVALIGLILLAACSGQAEVGEPAAPAPAAQAAATAIPPTDAAQAALAPTAATEGETELAADPAADKPGAASVDEAETAVTAPAADLPAWQTLPLTDARSGATFTLADFAGQTVFVEPMATWCSNCRRQLQNVRAAQAQLGPDVIFIGLSVETTLDNAAMAAYATNEGFEWPFAVASEELLQALVAEFGRTVVNPPATPHFIIRPDGSFTELTTGIESAADLIAQLQAAAQ